LIEDANNGYTILHTKLDITQCAQQDDCTWHCLCHPIY